MYNPGILGGIFDFNRDGKLDVFEAAAESQFLNDMMSDDEYEDEFGCDFGENYDDDYDEDLEDEDYDEYDY